MSRLEDNLISFVTQMDKERLLREKMLNKELLQIYDQARKELYINFIEAQSGKNVLELQYLEGTIQNIESQMKYYTAQTVTARTQAIEGSFLASQELLSGTLTKMGTKLAVAVNIGMINRGMIEALVGNIPKLAGKVENDVLFRIRNELAKGAVMGESIPRIAKRVMGTGLTQEGLVKPFTSLKARADTIARTEIIKSSATGFIDFGDRAQGVIGEEIFYAWVTAGDDRVDPPCPALANGTDPRFKSVKGMPGVYRRDNLPIPAIASHPRCRCRLVPVLMSWVESGALNITEFRRRVA